MSKRKITIPSDITPDEFFLNFVPKTYAKEVKQYDMSGYEGFKLNVQVHVRENGKTTDFVLKMADGTTLETQSGTIADPDIRFTFDIKQFHNAVAGDYSWLPLDAAFDPEALREALPSNQARDEMEMLEGIAGQADIRVKSANGTAELRINFHDTDDQAVIFNTNEKIVEEIREGTYTVMEAFMASKIKVDGPIEFAMHVMALAPDREEDEADL